MKEQIKNIAFVWKTVFSNWKYSALTVLIFFAFFILNVVIQNYKTLISFFSSSGPFDMLKLLYSLTIGFRHTVTASSFITITLISLFLGIFFPLLVFKIGSVKKGKDLSLLGTIGIFLGIAAPGCAACGVGILALFGITAGALAALPLKGLEISILAILILGFSIYKVSKDLLECDSCKVYVKSKLERRQKK